MSGYETQEAPPLLGLGAMAGLIGLIVLALLMVVAMLAVFEARSPHEKAAPRPLAPGPRLESAPRSDRVTLETAARARLQGYGWTDRQAGLAHIPIDRAMVLQAERGWPDAEAGP